MKKILLIIILLMLPMVASANVQALADGAGVLCSIAGVFSGTIAYVIAVFAIFFLGIQAFNGRLQWTTVLVTALGIVLIFGIVKIIPNFVPESVKLDIEDCLNHEL